ncbi:linear amide C-N hydrolase [Fluviispira sanaruensis]|uniref:linear amide C-N hydrolase n=1 Tax=Fluviispira sanaruensis TaxID=2493639 RepID=UPI00102ED1E6
MTFIKDNYSEKNFLPGTNRAADRFARASFLIKSLPTSISNNYINAIPEKKFVYQAIASTLSVVRSVSVPLGISSQDQPNISSTIWRTVSDQKNKVYYFDSVTTPNTFWVDFKGLNFSKRAPIKKLTLTGGKVYSGNNARLFGESKPFEFLKADLTK